MDKRNFILDKQGQAFTLDVMLALVIIILILGISADAIDTASYKSTDYAARFSLERVTTDAADMLIKTPGSPDNWESGITLLTTPGLAQVDSRTGKVTSNTLSMGKIIALRNKYNSLIYGRVLPHGVNSSLMIYPADPALSPIEIKRNVPVNALEVAVANRTVTFDFLDVKAVIYRNHSGAICPNLNHQNPGDGSRWVCQYFNVISSELNSTDFYVITVPANIGDNSSWIIDRPEKASVNNGTGQAFSSTPINVTGQISSLLGSDNKGVLWFHVRTPGGIDRNFDAYIVSVPKGTPLSHVSFNPNPEPWFFVLRVWY